MTIRCNRCGCAKFFYTLTGWERVDLPNHHGACCAECFKPLDLRDVIKKRMATKEDANTFAE